jgi:DNA-binding MarR family transcriptional regulator
LTLARSFRKAYIVNVTLNTSADREALATALLDELTTHDTRGWVHKLRNWPGGGVSLVHLHALMTLRDEGPLSMSRFAELLDVSEASASGIVNRMERRGLVERNHSADDRRLVLVQLTERGRVVLTALGVDRRLRLARLLAELTDEELAGFLAGLRALRSAAARLREASPDEAADR